MAKRRSCTSVLHDNSSWIVGCLPNHSVENGASGWGGTETLFLFSVQFNMREGGRSSPPRPEAWTRQIVLYPVYAKPNDQIPNMPL